MAGLYEKYMDYVAPFKGSKRYHKWAIIATIGALLERRCWYPIGGLGRLHPNMYILLVGGAGTGKSTVGGLVASLVKEHNRGLPTLDERIKFGPTKFSPAALIETFKRTYVKRNDVEQSAMWFYSSELSTGIKDIGGGSVADDLLEFFDCNNIFEKDTLSGGKVEIIKPCLNILGCTTPSFISKFLPREQSGTGLAARLILVPEFDRVPMDPEVPVGDKAKKRAVMSEIARIHSIEGAFTNTPDVKDFWAVWYEQNQTEIYKESDGSFMRDYLARKGVMIRKIAMCLSASRSCDMIITKMDYVNAIAMLDEIQPDMLRCFTVTDSRKVTDFAKQIMDTVPADRNMSKGELLKALYEKGIGGLIREVDQNIEFLVTAKLIRQIDEDDTLYYRRFD